MSGALYLGGVMTVNRLSVSLVKSELVKYIVAMIHENLTFER